MNKSSCHEEVRDGISYITGDNIIFDPEEQHVICDDCKQVVTKLMVIYEDWIYFEDDTRLQRTEFTNDEQVWSGRWETIWVKVQDL